MRKEEEDDRTIFDYLNEDCLVEILSYLPIEHIFNVAQAHPRFSPAVQRRYAQEKEVVINEDWVGQCPRTHLQEFYEESGRMASSLHFRCVSEEIIVEILPFYHNLDLLGLSKTKLESPETVEILPSRIGRLHLDRCHIKQPFLELWFQKLNPTLQELHFSSSYIEVCFDALSHLNHIQNLVIDGRCFLMDNLKEFLDRNQAQLRHFELRNYDGDMEQSVWKSLTKAHHLQILHLDITSILPELNSQGERGIFPELQRFNLQVRLQYTMSNRTQQCQMLDSFGCEDTLRFLSCGEVRGDHIIKFRNLEELEIQEDFIDNFTSLLDLSCLTKLRFLVFHFLRLEETDEELLTLIQQLPLLKKLILHECELSATFFDRLKIYLVSANRFIEITSSDTVESTINLKHTPEMVIDLTSSSDDSE